MQEISCRFDRRFKFDPATTALLAIDFQRYFFHSPEGARDESMWKIVPRVAVLLDWARQAGCRVVYTREAYAPDLGDVSAYRLSLGYVGEAGPMGRALITGEPGQEILQPLKPRPGEVIIDKPGFSAFFKSGLDRLLRSSGIDRLVLCGVTTQCCVHSTLREAVDLGYWCLTVADCCAATEPGLHDAALSLIPGEGHLFGWICDLQDLSHS